MHQVDINMIWIRLWRSTFAPVHETDYMAVADEVLELTGKLVQNYSHSSFAHATVTGVPVDSLSICTRGLSMFILTYDV